MTTPIDALMNSLDWKPSDQPPPTESGLPYVTHSGVLDIAGIQLRCYRLNDGRAIFDADDVHRMFGDFLQPLSEDN